ncbi:hypothetical protein Gotur_011712, partial [Gossypium turneri]
MASVGFIRVNRLDYVILKRTAAKDLIKNTYHADEAERIICIPLHEFHMMINLYEEAKLQ